MMRSASHESYIGTHPNNAAVRQTLRKSRRASPPLVVTLT